MHEKVFIVCELFLCNTRFVVKVTDQLRTGQEQIASGNDSKYSPSPILNSSCLEDTDEDDLAGIDT